MQLFSSLDLKNIILILLHIFTIYAKIYTSFYTSFYITFMFPSELQNFEIGEKAGVKNDFTFQQIIL